VPSLDGINTTLGRGGSDYSAAILAGALNTTDLEIWTDVNGMFTTQNCKTSTSIAFISYQEAMELSHFGAKVLYPNYTAVLKKNIPILIKNTLSQKPREH
jgi:aspartokinase/homoserine dehydrogenase 1